MNSSATPTVSRNILAVDDDPFVLGVLVRILKNLGLEQVKTCADGQQALDIVAQSGQDIDVILLDINMPEMDGIEFIRQLVTLRYQGEIVLVSGESSRMLESVERLVRSHGLGLLGSVHKPPSPEVLKRMLCENTSTTGAHRHGRQRAAGPTLAELTVAIDDGQIINFYQPQISLTTGQVVGAECLVRWQREDGTIVGPDQFIPLAEEFNLINRITAVVLESATRQTREWSNLGLQVPVSVNVSMQDICALDFPNLIGEITSSAQVDPRLITLEVTESRMLQHLSTVLDVISRLKLKRFQLSIDDFGTGHSSLAQLRDLPFDEIKIDRGFVHGAADNTTQQAICSATLRMAAQLGMSVVAEGIEREQDRRMLQDMGCEVGQGYLFARPIPADDLTDWLRRHQFQHASDDQETG